MPILLTQLPVPQLNFARRTGNIPLAAACLQQAWSPLHPAGVEILDQASATYLGDGALLEAICARRPAMVGFSAYAWNVDRSLDLARRLKERLDVRILLGGPEITPDNPRIRDSAADLLVSGEGESLLSDLNADTALWEQRWVSAPPDAAFARRPSPYLGGCLDPTIEDMVLLETQRGCPHRCGYCFYGKGRRGIHLAQEADILTAARWAHDRGVGELYLLDPSLDARPGLKHLLGRLASLNADQAMALYSEIRAEAVDDALADCLAAAGFQGLEIGLQSTNPAALKRTGRSCHLERFIKGTQRLTARGIACSVDLIIGLPGDTLTDFRRSVDLVADHGLDDHLQVFPLAILPGTRFRRDHRRLGLHYDPAPPYLLTHSDTFSGAEIEAALDYAESRCGLALYPKPDLDIAWRQAGTEKSGASQDLRVSLDGHTYISKLALSPSTTPETLQRKATILTHPYQVFVDGRIRDQKLVETAIGILTSHNPHTPLELVLLAPAFQVRVDALLDAACLARPHYLDKDLRYAYSQPESEAMHGNRAMMITLATPGKERRIKAPMCRQVFWWQAGRLPEMEEVQRLGISDLDGLLLGGASGGRRIARWQERHAPQADELPPISFEAVTAQHRWLTLTANDQYLKRFSGV